MYGSWCLLTCLRNRWTVLGPDLVLLLVLDVRRFVILWRVVTLTLTVVVRLIMTYVLGTM